MRRLLRRLGASAAVVALAGLGLSAQVATAPTASAHDVLVSTVPADGSNVASVPDQVKLIFEEPALAVGTTVVVTGPSGPVQQGRPELVDNTVSQAVTPGAPPGSYTVSWRASSADGHPISGSFTFTAKTSSGTAATSSGAGTATSSGAGTATSPGAGTATSPGATDSSSPTGPPTPGATTAVTPPASAAQTPASGTASTRHEAGSGFPWVWVVLGVLVLAAIVGLGAVALRHSSGADEQ